MEGGFQVQRELAQRQAFDAKLADGMLDVPEVAEAGVLKSSEHGLQGQGGQKGHGTGASEELSDESMSAPAEGAWPHLDLLA